jgi:hypothetical protein
MAQAVFGSPIKEIKGEVVNCEDIGNAVGYAAIEPGFHEVLLHCVDEDIGILLNPSIDCVLIYDGSTYTDYTPYSKDRSASTHVPLDALNGANGAILYVGASDKFGGIYFDIGTEVGNTAANMDWEYSSDATNFTDFSGEVDGTNAGGGPFGQDGAITFNAVPSAWHKTSVGGYGGGDLYWARCTTSAALNGTLDVNEMFTVNKGTDYGRLLKNTPHRFSINTQKVGALQLGTVVNTGDITVNWIKH